MFCWPQRLADRLARIRVTVDKDAKPEAARAPAPAGAPAGASCFSAAVQVPKGKSVSVEVSASFTGVMAPNPKRILQEEKQMMEYEDTLYLLSPYPISSQTTTVLLPTTEAAASFSPKDKGADKDGKIVFEKLGAAKPWDATPMRAHFHHDKQFKKVVRLVREIEVSHWGNIYVEESYVIVSISSISSVGDGEWGWDGMMITTRLDSTGSPSPASALKQTPTPTHPTSTTPQTNPQTTNQHQ